MISEPLLNSTDNLARDVARELEQQNKKIVFAESCTAGLVSASLAKVPGISQHHCGSAVTYRNDSKHRWLGVSAQLLEAAEKQILEGGFRRVCAGLLRDDQFGYAGLDPIGHGIGIPAGDSRITALLQEHGYAPQRDVARMTASIVGYRPPVNREALQFRRTTRVKTVSFRPRDAGTGLGRRAQWCARRAPYRDRSHARVEPVEAWGAR